MQSTINSIDNHASTYNTRSHLPSALLVWLTLGHLPILNSDVSSKHPFLLYLSLQLVSAIRDTAFLKHLSEGYNEAVFSPGSTVLRSCVWAGLKPLLIPFTKSP